MSNSLNHTALDAIDRAFNIDDETRGARNRMLATLGSVNSAEALWNLYREAAVPPGAPLMQLTETRRAIFWAVSAVATIGAQDPERLGKILDEVQKFAEAELRTALGRVS